MQNGHENGNGPTADHDGAIGTAAHPGKGPKTVVMGAGPGGLCSAYVLSKAGIPVTVVERAPFVGGLARTIHKDTEYGQFKFDIGGHRWFTKNEELNDLFKEVVAEELLWVNRISRIYFDGHFIDYPLKVGNALKEMGPFFAARAMADYGVTQVKNKLNPVTINSMKDGYVLQYGPTLYKQFFQNYSTKVWGVDPGEMSADWVTQRTKGMSIMTAVKDTDITSQSKVFLENAQANDTRLNAAQVQLAVVETLERYLRNPRPDAPVPSTLGLTDEALDNLVEQLTTLRLQREELLTTTPEDNPLFQPLNAQIRATQVAIKSSVRNIKASLQTTIQELQSFDAGFESSIKDIPAQERQLVSKKRQLAIKENLYTYLLQKREEAALSYAATLADARIIDAAYVLPAKWPNRWLIYALAGVLGLILPAAALQIKQGLSTKTTTRTEIEQATQVPILAELPFEKLPVTTAPGHPASALSEQMRSLRSHLPRKLGSAGRVILVTSSVAGEGKSFLSLQLAATLAHTGQPTVLVDLDLRRSGLTTLLGKPHEQPGVSDVLAQRAAWPSVVRPLAHTPGLHLVGSGTQLAHAADLLAGSQLPEFMENLRTAYSHVVLDSPPLHLVADALLLAQFSDVTLYVVRQGVTDHEELAFIEQLRQQGQLPDLRLVFNGINRSRYGYGYQYDTAYYGRANSV